MIFKTKPIQQRSNIFDFLGTEGLSTEESQLVANFYDEELYRKMIKFLIVGTWNN